jgi:hypothetical protein
MQSSQIILVTGSKNNATQGKWYNFDRVYGPQTTQAEVYKHAAEHLVHKVRVESHFLITKPEMIMK